MNIDITDKLIKDFMFLWATIDPIGTLALFASLTHNFTPEHRNKNCSESHSLFKLYFN